MTHESGHPTDRDVVGPLLVAEYTAAREVVLHARQIQHQVVSWSVAAIGLLASAGAVLARGQGTLSPAATQWAIFVLLAVVVPGAAVSAGLVWAGEVSRHQRAAEFLRSFEEEVEQAFPAAPVTVRYDRFVAAENTEQRISPTAVGRLGVVLLFDGMILLSVGSASALMWIGGAFDDWSQLLLVLAQFILGLGVIALVIVSGRWWWETRGTGSN